MSDMYFDPNSFNFEDLVDVVEDSPKDFKRNVDNQSLSNPDGGVIETARDLIDPEEREPEAPQELDPNSDVSDLLYSEEDKSDASDDFNYLPDDYLIDFGGRKATKAEVNQKLAIIEEIEQKADFISAIYEKAEQGTRWLTRESGVSVRSIDNEIAQLTQDIHSAPNQAIKGELYDKLIRKQEERSELYKNVDAALQVDAAIKRQAIAANTFNVNNLMKKKYPDFEQVMGKAIEDMKANRVNPIEFEQRYNPWIADKVYKAMKAELTENDRVNKAFQASEARRAARSQSNSNTNIKTQQQDKNAERLAMLKRKQATHGLTKQEHSEMFQYLKD